MTTNEMKWSRSKTGIYRSECGRWHICNINNRGWRLQDIRQGGKTRYYHSLSGAKVGAIYHSQEV